MGISESSMYRVVFGSGANIVRALKNEYEVLHAKTGNTGCKNVTAIRTSSDEDGAASTSSDGEMFESGEDESHGFEQMGRKKWARYATSKKADLYSLCISAGAGKIA